MPRQDEGALRELLITDPRRGWRAFIDRYTPLILSVIEQAGVTTRDAAMEVYVLVCDRLAEDDCRRLRRHDPSRGALSTWVGTIARHTLVDWVRSQTGRRRLFGSISEPRPLRRAGVRGVLLEQQNACGDRRTGPRRSAGADRARRDV